MQGRGGGMFKKNQQRKGQIIYNALWKSVKRQMKKEGNKEPKFSGFTEREIQKYHKWNEDINGRVLTALFYITDEKFDKIIKKERSK